jgi:hypothetical protein
VDALKIPFVIVPLVNHDNNQHSFDENVRVGHLLDGGAPSPDSGAPF